MLESSEISCYSDKYNCNLCGQKLLLHRSMRNQGTNVFFGKTYIPWNKTPVKQ